MASSSLITGSSAALAAAGTRLSSRALLGWNVRPSGACRRVEVRISSVRQQQLLQPQRRRSTAMAAAAAAMDDEGDEEDAEDDIGMTEEEIKQAYEALYGPSWDRKKKPGSSSLEDEDGGGRGRGRKSDDTTTAARRGRGGASKDGFEESVVQVRRVTKVVKGGKQLHFRVVSVVGDKKGKVGVGVGKAKEVIAAVQKSVKDARRHMVIVPITKYKTFPHRADGHYGAADVMLRPASPGTGVLAGGSVRIVLEMAGVENALGKQLGGSSNCLNNARATLDAISQMRHYHEVAELRNIPVQELWK